MDTVKIEIGFDLGEKLYAEWFEGARRRAIAEAGRDAAIKGGDVPCAAANAEELVDLDAKAIPTFKKIVDTARLVAESRKIDVPSYPPDEISIVGRTGAAFVTWTRQATFKD